MATKRKLNALVLILLILTAFSGFMFYQTINAINEEQDIIVAWTMFIDSKYNMNLIINSVNQGYVTAEDAVTGFNTQLADIQEAKTMLEPIFTGGDELIYVNGFLNFGYNFTKVDLEQAIISPNPKTVLRTTETQDEISMDTDHSIEESNLDLKFDILMFVTIAFGSGAFILWTTDRANKRKK